MSHQSAFAGVAPSIEDAQSVADAANAGELWGIALPGAQANAAIVQGDPWFLIVSEEWSEEETTKLGAAISGDWPSSCAAGPGSDILALGIGPAYLAALLGVQR